MTTLDELMRSPPEPAIKVPEENWRGIEAAVGLKQPDPWFRVRVARYVLMYFDDPNAVLQGIRPSHLRKSINKTLEHAKRLRADLVFEDEEATVDPQEWAQAYVAYWSLMPRNRETLVSRLDTLIKSLEADLASLPPDRGGHLPDVTLQGFIQALAAAYEIATGKFPRLTYDDLRGKYRGIFLNFVQRVLKVFAPQYLKSNLSLGKAIQRALKPLRARTGMDKT